MATNSHFPYFLNSVFFSRTDPTVQMNVGFYACDNAVVSDQINGNLANYTKLLNVWGCFDYTGQTNGSTNLFICQATAQHGSERSTKSFYVRQVWTVDELNRYGYVSATSGGIWDKGQHFDINIPKTTVDYEPIYGHGVTTWPQTKTLNDQFRNSSSLPADGTSKIYSTGSSFNRDPYLTSCYYIFHIITTGTIGSGNVSFIVEKRPTYAQNRRWSTGNVENLSVDTYASEALPYGLTVEDFMVSYGRIYHPGSVIWRDTYMESVYSPALVSTYPIPNSFEHRIRDHAIFNINPEYYGVVYSSKLAVMSNKCSCIPLRYYNLADTWTSAAYPRIGGALAVGLDIYTISESGEFVKISGSTITSLATAPTLANSYRRYSSLAYISGTIYALSGTYSFSEKSNSDSQIVSVNPYNISGGTWGTAVDFTAWKARINGKSLNEMIAYNSKLYILAEDVVDATTAYLHGSLSQTDSLGITGTIVVKLSAAYLFKSVQDSLTVTPIYIKFKTKAAATIASMAIKRVPAGSSTGTSFTDSTPIAFSGVSTNIAFVAETERTSDSIALTISNAYDYYLVLYNSSNIIYKALADSNISTYSLSSDQRSMTAIPDWTSWNSIVGSVGITALFATAQPTISNVNSGIQTSSVKYNWQLLEFDPSGSTWNSSSLTHPHLCANANAVSVRDSALLSYRPAGLVGIAGQIVAMGGLTSIGLVTYNGTTLSSIGYGGDRNVLGLTLDSIISIQTSSEGDAVVLAGSGVTWTPGNEVPLPIYYIGNNFNWISDIAQIYLPNVRSMISDPDYAMSIVKNRYFPSNLQGSSYGTGLGQVILLVNFKENQFTTANCDEALRLDGTVYISKFVNYMGHATHNLPCYYKWNGSAFVRALTFEEASASPKSVPTILNTSIPLVDGLMIQFGDTLSTTFQADEFHTFNVCYGNVKYSRKMQYSVALFPGQTFVNSETKLLSDVNAVCKHWINKSAWTETLTGPSGVLTRDTTTSTFRFPRVVGGVLNDATATLEVIVNDPGYSVYVKHNSTTKNTLTYATLSGNITQVVSASSETNLTGLAYQAFASANIGWVSTGSLPQWVQIDLGQQKTIRSYSFLRGNTDSQCPRSWTVSGSNDGSAWTTIDSRTNIANFIQTLWVVTTPGLYRYYRFNVTAVNGSSYASVKIAGLYESATVSSSINFSELAFDSDYARGHSFYVDKGSGYVQIYPVGRSLRGWLWWFARQENVQKVKIVFKQAANIDATYAGIPVFNLFDYGTQAVMDKARLGSSLVSDGDPARGSFDVDCLGVSVETPTILIDDVYNPLSTNAYLTADSWYQNAIQGDSIPANKFAIHPYWGFVFLTGASIDHAPYMATGTNLAITYHWGRRV